MKKVAKKKLVDSKTPVDLDSIPTAGAAWRPSRLRDGDLEVMEAAGLIPLKIISEWHTDHGHGIPFETSPNEVTVFTPFFEHGFGLPLHHFVIGLLRSMVSTQSI